MEWSYYEPRISEHTRPLGFRVGSGLVVMLDAMPPRVFLFDLAAPTHPLGGPVLSGDANRHLQIGLNGRVVGVTKPGVAWFLNHDRSDVISLDIATAGILWRISLPGLR
jgi:hypothetical protein